MCCADRSCAVVDRGVCGPVELRAIPGRTSRTDGAGIGLWYHGGERRERRGRCCACCGARRTPKWCGAARRSPVGDARLPVLAAPKRRISAAWAASITPRMVGQIRGSCWNGRARQSGCVRSPLRGIVCVWRVAELLKLRNAGAALVSGSRTEVGHHAENSMRLLNLCQWTWPSPCRRRRGCGWVRIRGVRPWPERASSRRRYLSSMCPNRRMNAGDEDEADRESRIGEYGESRVPDRTPCAGRAGL